MSSLFWFLGPFSCNSESGRGDTDINPMIKWALQWTARTRHEEANQLYMNNDEWIKTKVRSQLASQGCLHLSALRCPGQWVQPQSRIESGPHRWSHVVFKKAPELHLQWLLCSFQPTGWLGKGTAPLQIMAPVFKPRGQSLNQSLFI